MTVATPNSGGVLYAGHYDKLPLFVRPLARFKDWAQSDWSGGPKPFKLSWIVNAFKAGTFAFCLERAHANGILGRSPTMALYTGLHGAYGIAWCLKELTFPDPNWDRYVSFGTAAAGVFGILLPYWVAPYLLARDVAAGGAAAEASPTKMTLCTLTFVLGVVLMTGADAQKYFILKEKQRAAAEAASAVVAPAGAAATGGAAAAAASSPSRTASGEVKQNQEGSSSSASAPASAAGSKRLISDGFFALVRHPNYLGEMLLYGAFAALSGRREPWYILLYVWTFVFLPNMLQKEVSMSRYPEWPAYFARTGMLIPKGWPRAVLVGLTAAGAAFYLKSRSA